MATLKDVARAAGVDVSTASRVLRNDPAQLTRAETRDRIVAAAAQLDYRPNALARSLRTRRSDALAFIVPDLDNIGFSEITRGIRSVVNEAGYLLIIADARDLATDPNLFARLTMEGRVDGLLVASATKNDEVLRRIAETALPTVLVNRRQPGPSGSVIVDDEGATIEAVEHLVALGHRDIGHISGPLETDTGVRRQRAFLRGLTTHGLRLQASWVREGDYTESGGREAMAQILKHGEPLPTAMFVANLMSAIGAMAAMRAGGLRIPGDISFITLDNHFLCDYVDPPLTVVAQPLYEMGVEAARMVIQAAGGGDLEHKMIDQAPQLVLRRSTASPSN